MDILAEINTYYPISISNYKIKLQENGKANKTQFDILPVVKTRASWRFSPDSVEGADRLDVLGQLLGLRPLEVVDDWNDVALGLEGGVHLLRATAGNIVS